MKFSEYCDIMQTRGIDELSFLYCGKEECITMYADNFLEYVAGEPLKVGYEIVYADIEFDDFGELLQAKVFNGKALEEIWSDIECVTFENKTEKDFLSDLDYSNFEERTERRKQEYLEENDLTQKQIFWSPVRSYLYMCGYSLLGLILVNVIFLIPGLCLHEWNYMLLFALVDVATIPICMLVLWKNAIVVSYTITDRKIEVYNGLMHTTRYDNIRKVTMRKYRNKKGCGTIQIYVKKGLSLNFRMSHVPDVDEVYRLITDNLNKSRQN